MNREPVNAYDKRVPAKLAIIAGSGVYPGLLAQSATKQGVSYLFAIAFKKETDPAIERIVDDVKWLKVGQLDAALSALQESGIRQVVMVGQITPIHLFRIRPDRRMFSLLNHLSAWNAKTIFGGIANELESIGIELLPAYLFMEDAMPLAGLLTRRKPTEQEQEDIKLGFKVAKATSGLEIGQTVAVKQGTILAVEAFEGTDATILRAGRLGGAGIVVVKVAKEGHDMRFDIPVIGVNTLKSLKKVKAAVLAVEAKRTILLEREKFVSQANSMGLCLTIEELGNNNAGKS